MTEQEWTAQTHTRVAVNEGCRLYKYRDGNGVVTLGTGFNLERADAQHAITTCGGDWQRVVNGPVAIDSEPENAVEAVITQAVADALFEYSLQPIVSDARSSLAPNVFDTLSDARRFVVCDMVFNLGLAGWVGFTNTRLLINEAQEAKNAGDPVKAHQYFGWAANHMQQSAWYEQVGDRAMRDCAMMRTSEWCDPHGDGSDVI